MRKVVLIMISLLLCFAAIPAHCISVTELEDMSFDDLLELQAALQAEMLSRPESEISILDEGKYLVGKDILPGGYYFRIVDNPYYGAGNVIRVYENEERWKEDKTFIYHSLELDGVSSAKLQLEEGQILTVDVAPVMISRIEFEKDDYMPPQGTIVVPGDYIVGVDMPAGRYTAYYNGVSVSSLCVYKDSQTATEDPYYGTFFEEELRYLCYSCQLTLQDGYVLRVKHNPFVMKKNESMLDFN